MSVHRDVLIEPTSRHSIDPVIDPVPGARVSWSGIFGGVVVGLGTLLLLTALGLAIGITAVDPNNPDATTIGASAGIWTAVSLLIALFIGGWAAARMSMLWDRTAALFQGTLVWALSMVLILWLAASGIGLIAGQTFNLAGTVARSAGSAASGFDIGSLSQGNVDQILNRLNDPKTAQGIAGVTGMNQQEVSQRLSELRGRVEQARNDPQQVATEMKNAASDFADRARTRVQQAASNAQPTASRTAWTTFGALVLGLIAGMLGAAVGRRNAATRVQEIGGDTVHHTVTS